MVLSESSSYSSGIILYSFFFCNDKTTGRNYTLADIYDNHKQVSSNRGKQYINGLPTNYIIVRDSL